jgi:hypothetical protein
MDEACAEGSQLHQRSARCACGRKPKRLAATFRGVIITGLAGCPSPIVGKARFSVALGAAGRRRAAASAP